MLNRDDVEAINRISLDACNGIDCGDALFYPLLWRNNIKMGIKTKYTSIARILKDSIFCYYNVLIRGNPQTLLLYSTSYIRCDLLTNFQNVTSLVNNCLIMTPSKRKKFSFAMIKYLKVTLKWNSSLKKVIKSSSKRWYCISALYSSFLDYKYYEIISKDHQLSIDKLVTFCDVHVVDSFFTQKFNKQKKTSITLQHGTFSSTTNVWAFLGSHSNYFFAHGQFTLDEGKRVGYKNGKMIPVGLPSYAIDKHVSKPTHFNNYVVGVILDGEELRPDNIKTILFFQSFFKTRDKKLFIKFHPTSSVKNYTQYIDTSVVSKCYSKDISLVDFIEMIDIAIVCNSTALLELLEAWIPTFIFSNKKHKVDVYANAPDFRFESNEQLDQLISDVNRDTFSSRLEQTRDYFCAKGNTNDNYREAFHSMGIY